MAEDISSEVIKKTQKLLGKYVKKPALTEKLLKKPPFRFLHDVVISVIKETGFMKGLFSAEELVFENVKEKEAKLAFLNKLIDAVKTVTKTDLTVRASKIVAGLEPLKTNLLLQAIGKAVDDKIDISEYISHLSSSRVDTTEKKKAKRSTSVKDEKISKTKSKDDSTSKINKTKKVNESPRSKIKASTPKDSSKSRSKTDKVNKSDSVKKINVIEEEKVTEINEKEVVSEVSTTTKETASTSNNIIDKNSATHAKNQNNALDDSNIPNDSNDKERIKMAENPSNFFKESKNLETSNKEQEVTSNQSSENKEISVQGTVRPKSARPKNGDGINASSKQNKLHNQEDNFKQLQMNANQPQRPKSSLRPPSVRPSSARPGAPRLRPDSALPLQETVVMGNINVIVENVDNVDDEETVVIQTTSEVVEDSFNSVEVPKDNKGQLVEQILEQIQEGEGIKKQVDIDWEQDAMHNKEGATKEISQLRSLIQALTKTANPLGKLMNYLHEDVDAMHGELQMWTNIKNQLFSEIYKQKRLSVESNKPLLTQLEHLQEEIKKQQQEIVTVRSNIFRNELRIKELLNV